MAEPLYWPSGLPDIPLSDYTHALGNNTLRSSMEFGPSKTRRRSSAAPSIHTVAYSMDVEQKALFEEFFTIVGGHMSFWLPDPENHDKQYVLVRIVPSSDDKAVEFKWQAANDYTLALTLEVHPLVPPKVR